MRDEYGSELYRTALVKALLKVSGGKLDENVAQIVAQRYVSNLDFSSPELMHKGVSSVARELIVKIRKIHFQS